MNFQKLDVLVMTGYRGDEEARAVVVDDVKTTKAGKQLVVARDIKRNVFRSYYPEQCQNLQHVKG